jgi:predicted metalloprotease with PDZ domain
MLKFKLPRFGFARRPETVEGSKAGRSLIPIAWATVVAFLVMVYSVPVQGESAKLKIPSKAGGDLKSTKEGWLGVYVQEITKEIREAMNLKSEEGVLVRDVVDNSPADEAGIKNEDVILVFNQEKVNDPEHLIDLVRKTSPRDKVELVILRDDKEMTLTVTLGEAPENKLRETELPEFNPPKVQLPKIKPEIYKFSAFSGVRIGIKVEDLTGQLGEYFGVKDGEGALVTDVDEGGPAYKAGLKAGDVIVGADDKKIENTEDLIGIISDKKEGDKVEIKVIRDRKPQSLSVEVEKGKEWSSVYLKELEKVERLPEKSHGPEIFWEEKELRPPRGELQEKIQKLKEQMKELREELENLKEKLK